MQGIGQTADTSVSVVPASIHHSNHALPLTHPKNTTEERLSSTIILRKFTYGFSPWIQENWICTFKCTNFDRDA
jgi:hypothetical protein